jgi:hypothetical protein
VLLTESLTAKCPFLFQPILILTGYLRKMQNFGYRDQFEEMGQSEYSLNIQFYPGFTAEKLKKTM